MKVLALIPARGGSKGIPRKNIKLLNGKPLLKYTSDTALKVKIFDRVLLSTDDQEIADIGKKLGLYVPFLRPKNLSGDTSSTLSVIKHALDFLRENEEENYDAVCLLQVTTPFRTVEFIERALRKFKNSGAESLISVLEVPHVYNPHWVFKEDTKGFLEIITGDKTIISRRQDLPKTFHRDGSIYITDVNTILNKNSLYGDTTTYIQSSIENYVNIDTLSDWEAAEDMTKKLKY